MKNPLRALRAVVAAVVLLVGFPIAAHAQKVAVLAAEDPTLVADVQAKLLATGRLTQVDVIDVGAAGTPAPALATLLQYDAVIVWSDNGYGNPIALGNVLADYVDQGHGVVEAVFTFDSTSSNVVLGGRWRLEAYDAITLGPGDMATLALVADVSAHPILAGVTGVATGENGFYHSGVFPAPCAQLVAHWNNGAPLVATCAGPHGGRVVALNMFPPSSDVVDGNWLSNTNGGLLMANALVYAGAASAPVNNPPTVSAGFDQVIEASGPGLVPFSLTASAVDPDGNAVTYAWSGPVSGTAAVLTGGLPLPAAPGKSAVYSFVVTVSDGHGGQATDDVTVTVRDTTPPVLSGVPSGVVSAAATSSSGASVPYGPVKATDAVDGTRPVTCAPSGVFPVGDTTVTCTSSDTRGNTSSAKFTVRVTNASVPGLMLGFGYIDQNNARYDFGFVVRERASGTERAVLELGVTTGSGRTRRQDSFVAKSTTAVTFSDDPTFRPGFSARPQVDTVAFSGVGEWNGRSGYRYEALATDQGEPGRHRETFRITVTAPNGTVVARVDGTLSGGNVQSARIRH